MSKRVLKYSPYLGIGLGWIYISSFDKIDAKKSAYNKGYMLSQKFKKYPSWDRYMEPFIINQFAFLFGVSNAFIKGLISDNEPNPFIKESLEEMNNEITEDISKESVVNKHY